MPLSIVLKNASNTDVTFVESQHDGDSITFVAAGTSLLDRKILQIRLRNNGATNRVVAKLSLPTVKVNPTSGIPGVAYTEVGSMDLSAVKAASSEDAADFMALFASLAASDTVKDLYCEGVWSETAAA